MTKTQCHLVFAGESFIAAPFAGGVVVVVGANMLSGGVHGGKPSRASGSLRTNSTKRCGQTSPATASRLCQPRFGCRDFGRVEVAKLGHREGFAHLGHPFFPGLFADQGDAVNLRAVSGGK